MRESGTLLLAKLEELKDWLRSIRGESHILSELSALLFSKRLIRVRARSVPATGKRDWLRLVNRAQFEAWCILLRGDRYELTNLGDAVAWRVTNGPVEQNVATEGYRSMAAVDSRRSPFVSQLSEYDVSTSCQST